MTVYLWWPYPTPFGFDALSALTPAFGRQASVPTAGQTPHEKFGIVYAVTVNAAGAAGEADTVIHVDDGQIALNDADSVFIVGHCSAGVTSLVGEYASLPVALRFQGGGPAATHYTDFAVPEEMDFDVFLQKLEAFAKRKLPVVAGQRVFNTDLLQKDLSPGPPNEVVRVYAPNEIQQTHTSIAAGIVTMPNAERQHVAKQHRDKFTGEEKSRSDFEKSARALAYLFREKFQAGDTAAKVVLWACYSADKGDNGNSLAHSFNAEVSKDGGPTGLEVYGCLGKASSSAKPLPGKTQPRLRIKNALDQWEQAVRYGNLAKIYNA
ncbi:hypothetical protein AB3Y40_09580 [Yoonia sp. R2331]|uniref:hypothetical protein n=1 Tax=Yoonia sp. R2331 TaxID=3237238 RepID=UPI0034E39A94